MLYIYFRIIASSIIGILAFLASISHAYAYVGPGLGVGAIAVVLGIVGSVFLAIFAIFWYPIKRMLKNRKADAGGVKKEEAKP